MDKKGSNGGAASAGGDNGQAHPQQQQQHLQVPANTSSKGRRHSGAGPTLSTSIEQLRGATAAGEMPIVAIASSTSTAPTPIKAILHDDPKSRKKSKKSITGSTVKSVGLFSHLVQYESGERELPVNIHPAVIRFFLRSQTYQNLGGAQRCKEMLLALKEAIRDYRANPEMAICRHLDSYLKPMIGYMVEARPMAIAMANAVRALRNQISILPLEMAEHEAQEAMYNFIDNFITNRFELADKLIIQYGQSKIVDGDVILTFAKSTVVRDLLIHAKQQAGKKFRVIVVDSRPFQEGARLLEELVAQGIACSYVNINAVAYVMKEVSKTIVGAAGIYANGTLLSRTGTAAVCAISRRSNVPVIVCSETIKFSDRLQIDSFVFNEIGDPDALVKTADRQQCEATLSGWKMVESLKLLNILYDVTPSEYVTVAITEIGLIPVTSIPVVLREYSTNSAVSTYSHDHYHQQIQSP